MKKLLSFFLMFAIALTMSLGVSAQELTIGESKDSGKYILSNPVPEDVVHYAQEQFKELDLSWVDVMGLNDKASELKLGAGFDITLYSTGNSTGIYYFPVLYQDRIEKFLAVITNDGNYHTQSGYGYLAKPLNDLKLELNNPVQIVASDDAIYAVDTKNNVTILFEEVWGNPENIEEQVKNLSQPVSSLSNKLDVVNVTEIRGESINMISSLSEIEERATSKKLSVAFLNNRLVDNKGVCWAATAASCIDFYEDGKANTTHAQSLMDELIQDRKDNTGSTDTGISDVVDYIESYCPNLTASTTTKLAFTKAKSYIDKKYPLYTRWLRVSDDAGHAIVLCGYKTGSKDEMYLMDSNYTDEYQVCTFGENYQTPGTSKFRWSRTLTVK